MRAEILLLAAAECPVGRAIALALPGAAICHDLDTLSLRLRDLLHRPSILVLVVRNREELQRLLALHDWFCDLPTVLLLPERDSETVALGHRLKPRMLSYIDGDLKDVLAVMEHLLARLDRKEYQR